MSYLAAGLPRVALRQVALRHSRCGFATSTFVMPGKYEQTLFVIGLDEKKFFGQGGSEEGLKLLERVAARDEKYSLLLEMNDRELNILNNWNPIENKKLSPTREFETETHAEMIPLVQAGTIDGRPINAMGRDLGVTQARCSAALWERPREALNLYRTLWKRRLVKHDSLKLQDLYKECLPTAAYAYYDERAEVLATRTSVHLHERAREESRNGVSVLAVSAGLFDSVVSRLRLILEDRKAEDVADLEFARPLRERAQELCREPGLDLCAVIVALYGGLPLLALYGITGLLVTYVHENHWESSTWERVGMPLIGYDVDRSRD